MPNTATRPETEPELIQRAQSAVSRCNWDVGECASLWTKRFARGRTDADFAMLVGLTGDQVYQRRRVWETFGDVSGSYPALKWSHFYTALTWDDAAECLQWANDIDATVAEMKAWRRAQRGEDLSELSSEDSSGWLPTDPVEVRVPNGQGGVGAIRDGQGFATASDADAVPFVGSVPRQSDSGDDYAPFRADALTPPVSEKAERPAPTVEQVAKRLINTLERCLGVVNADEFSRQFAQFDEKDQKRLRKVLQQLGDKAKALH